jgi:hypothetical protein
MRKITNRHGFRFIRRNRAPGFKKANMLISLGLCQRTPNQEVGMSTSLLYHGFSIRGYQYVRTRSQGGEAASVVRQDLEACRRQVCGSHDVRPRGRVEDGSDRCPSAAARPSSSCRSLGSNVGPAGWSVRSRSRSGMRAGKFRIRMSSVIRRRSGVIVCSAGGTALHHRPGATRSRPGGRRPAWGGGQVGVSAISAGEGAERREAAASGIDRAAISFNGLMIERGDLERL